MKEQSLISFTSKLSPLTLPCLCKRLHLEMNCRPLFYRPLFYRPLFYRPLFYRPLFYRPLFYCPLFYRPLFYRPLFYRPLFYRPLFYRPLIYRPLFYRPLFYRPSSECVLIAEVFADRFFFKEVIKVPIRHTFMLLDCFSV